VLCALTSQRRRHDVDAVARPEDDPLAGLEDDDALVAHDAPGALRPDDGRVFVHADGHLAGLQAGDDTLEKLGAIEGALTRLLPSVNPMKLPPKALNNRLAALTGAVQQADARPTRQMYAVFEALSAGVAEQVRQLDEVIATELPALVKQ